MFRVLILLFLTTLTEVAMLIVNAFIVLPDNAAHRFDAVEYTQNEILLMKQKYGISDEAARFNITLKGYPAHQLHKVSKGFVTHAGLLWVSMNASNIYLVLMKEDRKTLCQSIPKWANSSRLFETH